MVLILAIITITVLAIVLNRNIKNIYCRTDSSTQQKKPLCASLPAHYSYFFTLWSLILSIAIASFPISLTSQIVLTSITITILFFASKFCFNRRFNAKRHVEKFATFTLSATAAIGILITIAVTASILFEAIHFFKFVNPIDFFFNTSWNPQSSSTTDLAANKNAFGIIPVFLGTLLITTIAMLVAIPLGIMGAIYLGFYAKPHMRDSLKPILEILAGIPTVVYGYFAVVAVAPFLKNFFSGLDIEIAAESALAAGSVTGIMIIPFILSLSDDALNSVPQALKDGAIAMGSTKSEMIRKVTLPAAMPSIVGAIILAVSRAIGETMIVVMSAGLIAKLTFNPLDAATTATVQIVTLLVGDQEFDSPKTLAAFAIALTLFIFTLFLNIIALSVIKKYKKRSIR